MRREQPSQPGAAALCPIQPDARHEAHHAGQGPPPFRSTLRAPFGKRIIRAAAPTWARNIPAACVAAAALMADRTVWWCGADSIALVVCLSIHPASSQARTPHLRPSRPWSRRLRLIASSPPTIIHLHSAVEIHAPQLVFPPPCRGATELAFTARDGLVRAYAVHDVLDSSENCNARQPCQRVHSSSDETGLRLLPTLPSVLPSACSPASSTASM
ncbi:hypothetical protein DAEQUDRAFT_315007 [Daedalea quercina L-15889]|uniref:Uncharacterized protein n=1 Tax=Daedalea quercina L-15889 TaxID=1314783 RepID=A0A165PVK9_9APHY|nr:hypothetical protein DAEQUDRAFT_315007 [Daedalea quercina L-15889]